MGIPGLWDELGEGEVKSLAALSSEHYEKHQRPLRIAIDEAGWRFKNLNAFQVQQIREKEPLANPVEKAILYRILKLRRLNIQLLFIFDGPKRPHKRGGVAGRIDYKQIDLLQKVLNNLRVPTHRAPAEAEAECARLQQLGIVDAVWSEDSDTLMFGCDFLIRNHREKNRKSKSDTHVQVYRANVIWEKLGLDREALVLFALTSGCDYTKGIAGCGPKLALKAAKHEGGTLGRWLCNMQSFELEIWKQSAVDFFARNGVMVTPDFPHMRALKYCNTPTISTDEKLRNLRGLRSGWEKPFAHDSLRYFLRSKFNFSTKEYIKHIAPMVLVQKLMSPAHLESTARTQNHYGVIVPTKRRSQAPEAHLERKINFDPSTVFPFDLREQPIDESWHNLGTAKDPIFDPTAMVEFEILECILRKSVPDELFQAAPPKKPATKRKRKEDTIEEDHDRVAKPQKQARAGKSRPSVAMVDTQHRPPGNATEGLQTPPLSEAVLSEYKVIVIDCSEDEDLPDLYDVLNSANGATKGLKLDFGLQNSNHVRPLSQLTHQMPCAHNIERKEYGSPSLAGFSGSNIIDLT